MEDVAADLAAEGDIPLFSAEFVERRLLFLRLQIEEPRPEDLHRLRAVLVLRPLVLAGDDDAGWKMRETDRGVRDVDVLAPRAARAIRVDAEILFLDVDLDVLGQLGPDVDRREGRMPARGLIEWRDADQPMDACFSEHQAVGVVAVDFERRALDPRFVTRLCIHDLALEAAALCPAQVHPQQHFRPVLRLGAAGARMNRDDRVLPIVLPAEHLLGFAGVDFLSELVEAVCQIVGNRLPRLRPLDEHSEVVRATAERVGQPLILLEAAAALHDFLRGPLVLPEVRVSDTLFYFREFFAGTRGVKDSSAGRTHAWRDPGTGGAARLAEWWA